MNLSKLLVAGLLLGAGAAQAAGPVSVSEVPASWYADRIVTSANARGAIQPVFPSAAYEPGQPGDHYVDVQPRRPIPTIGSASPFPFSPNETGRVL